MKKAFSFAFTAFALCALLVSRPAFGGGFQLYSESATDMLGTAGAGVARGGNASAAWYNPATTIDITRPTLTAGGSLIRLAIDYKTSVATDRLDSQPRVTGFFYGVLPMGDDFRLNLGVNAPYGMITQWKHDSQLSSLATFTSLRVCYISPSITWKVTDGLSLAAGPNMTIGVARLANYIDIPVPGQARNKNYMSADDFGFGGFVAAYYKINDAWAVGAKYQSKVHMNFDGKNAYRHKSYLGGMLNFTADDANAAISMPASLSLGISNRSFEKWTFLFDAVWTEWSSYKALDVKFKKYPGTQKPGTARNPRGWHDTWTYHLGAEYQLTDKWLLRCGADYDVSPSNSRSCSPEMPDSDKWLLGLGAAYKATNWEFDLAYGYSRFMKTKLGTRVAKEHKNLERGTFKTDCHILSASVTYKF